MKLSRHFSREEFACECGCGFDTADIELVQVLEHVRLKYGKPVIITSGCRCVEHNEKVQKSANPNYFPYSSKSYHMQGRAADFVVEGVNPIEVYEWLNRSYPYRYGLGMYSGWCHLDTRTDGPARWHG